MTVQSSSELEEFYSNSDPWEYDRNPFDQDRRERLRSLLPKKKFNRTLDIGCGNGFITSILPGDLIVGCDVSEKAISFAQERCKSTESPNRFNFLCASLFDLPKALQINHSNSIPFDLIVITGVLYEQYVGKGLSLVDTIIDGLLANGGNLVSVHIDEWCTHRFPFTLLDASYYAYREWTHRLEVYTK